MERKYKKLPVAIPDPFPLFNVRFFEINERVTAFDDELHDRLKKQCNHYVRGDIDGQLSID